MLLGVSLCLQSGHWGLLLRLVWMQVQQNR